MVRKGLRLMFECFEFRNDGHIVTNSACTEKIPYSEGVCLHSES